MTAIITLPGVVTPAPGMERAIILHESGFVESGLQALHLFEDGAGTAAADEFGGAAGTVEHPVATNNAYSWLAGGGGLQLEGTEIVSFAAFEANSTWTLFSAGAMVGSVGGTASERISAFLGFRDFAVGAPRGALLFVRGGNDWNVPTTTPFYLHRPADGAGGSGTIENLIPASGLSVIDQPRLHALSYNGADTIASAVYDENGAIVASDTITVSDAQLFTISGTTVSALQPIVGGPNNTYSGGQQQIEAFARYSRSLDDFSSAELAAIAAAGAGLGAARGRDW